MKKTLVLLCVAVFVGVFLAGCGNNNASSAYPSGSENSTQEGAINDPGLDNEVKVDSNGPYISSGDQTYFVEDKVLNNGYTMPVLGIGTYALTVDEAENSVYHALKDGYRLVDTASAYNNEEGVGRGIKRAIDEGLVKREEIFVTTKVWDTDFGNARSSLEASLDRLGLDYVDLVLLHHVPRANDESAYHQLEEAVNEGKVVRSDFPIFILTTILLTVCMNPQRSSLFLCRMRIIRIFKIQTSRNMLVSTVYL